MRYSAGSRLLWLHRGTVKSNHKRIIINRSFVPRDGSEKSRQSFLTSPAKLAFPTFAGPLILNNTSPGDPAWIPSRMYIYNHKRLINLKETRTAKLFVHFAGSFPSTFQRRSRRNMYLTADDSKIRDRWLRCVAFKCSEGFNPSLTLWV